MTKLFVAELENVGLSPVRTLIQDFGGWPMLDPASWDNSTFDPEESIGELRRRLLDDAIISVYVERDLKNTSRNVIFVRNVYKLDNQSMFLYQVMFYFYLHSLTNHLSPFLEACLSTRPAIPL